MKRYIAELNNLRKSLDFTISNKKLISLALSVSRVADKKITIHINKFKAKYSIKLSALQKKNIRDYILGLSSWNINEIPPIQKGIIDEMDILNAIDLINLGIKRNKSKVSGTIKSRLNEKGQNKANISEYLEIIKKYEKYKNQLIIIEVSPDIKNTVEKVKSIIIQEYKNLANYHYIAIIFNKNSWDTISEIAIFCESYKKETNFGVFNKRKSEKINELNNFIKNNKNIEYTEQIKNKIKDLYQGVSYGFQFNDLIISSNDDVKIFVAQKIELDETILPCPDCMKKSVRGNSYPKLLQRSFECQNPDCPSRSKIGRGKRYDYFNVKRNTYLKIKNKNNLIDKDLLKEFRRDIFLNKDNIFDMLIQFFSWSGDKIKYISNIEKLFTKLRHNRKIEFSKFDSYKITKTKEVLLVALLREIARNIKIQIEKPNTEIVQNNFSIYEGNSSNILSNIKERISGVITSPPYYNAREYSQWPSLLCYLIDMTVNAKAVFEKMEVGTYYFYNIGDIVGQDNIFVSSHMSNRRLMLGFYSIIIFKMVGYDLIGNIIWDKGEVQSKRNSTENIFPTYIKPINCYEHILIFGKNAKKIKLSKNVLLIDTVKKINSKGENMLGHTAPYPEQLVELIFPYVDKNDGYILDPYLGSGTTVIAGYKNKFKTVGIEYNKNYFKLASNRILASIDNYRQKKSEKTPKPRRISS